MAPTIAHTDSEPFSGSDQYTNWELSTERANAARRVMAQRGLRPSQLRGVRGYADTLPRVAADPSDPRNRRVSIVVQDAETEAEADAGTDAAEPTESLASQGSAESEPSSSLSPEPTTSH